MNSLGKSIAMQMVARKELKNNQSVLCGVLTEEDKIYDRKAKSLKETQLSFIE